MQVQYRTLVLAIIGTTLFLTLSIVCGLTNLSAWTAVALIATLASIYTAFGGLRSVTMTDSLQVGVMTVAGLLIWFMVWGQVGAWGGIERRLNAHDPALSSQLLHAGHGKTKTEDISHLPPEQIQKTLLLGGQYDAVKQKIVYYTPGWLVVLAVIIMGMAYSIVNHTQSHAHVRS